MSSVEYAELAGLNIALSRLNLTDEIYRDKEWAYVTTWFASRIKQLESLKTR